TRFNNHPLALALVPRLGPQSRKAPRGLRVIALHAAFTSAVRMVNRVHGHAAIRRTAPVPARASRLAVGHVLVVEIDELSDSSHAVHTELSDFTGRQLYQRKTAFLTQQLRRPARRADHLRAFAWKQLEVMHHRAG